MIVPRILVGFVIYLPQLAVALAGGLIARSVARVVAVLRVRGELGRYEPRRSIWNRLLAADFDAVVGDLAARGAIEEVPGPGRDGVRRLGVAACVRVYRLTGRPPRPAAAGRPPPSFEGPPPVPEGGLAGVEAAILRALRAGGGTMNRSALREAMRPGPRSPTSRQPPRSWSRAA